MNFLKQITLVFLAFILLSLNINAQIERSEQIAKCTEENSARIKAYEKPLSQNKVQVVGQVYAPKVLEYKPNLSLIEALALAGGHNIETAGMVNIVSQHSKILKFNLRDVWTGKEKIKLSGGETIIVLNGCYDLVLSGDLSETLSSFSCSEDKFSEYEKELNQAKDGKILVLGEVFENSLFTFADDLTITQVLAMAGGFTQNAKSGNVWVLRDYDKNDKLDNQKGIIIINIKDITERKITDLKLQSSDIVFVPKNCKKNNLPPFRIFPQNDEPKRLPDNVGK